MVQMSVAEGDRVESGAVVAQLEDAQIQAQVGALVVVALTPLLTGRRYILNPTSDLDSFRCSRIVGRLQTTFPYFT